uniref:Solute carrier family 40 member n=1 Tax=Ciona savignyi TaxID=51511 RepID=H2Z6Q3_CIOSA
IYVGHFMSSWGDRMWYFAIPLFLMDLDPNSLFLTAAYGLTLSASVLLFAPLVGDWIDRTERLRALVISLVIQNMSVITSATILLLNREFGDNEADYAIAIKISALLLGAIAILASTATQIILQKDWIVVIAAKRTDFLTGLNAMMRRIDLFTKILSPLACGQIMAVATLTGGAIFILCWNTASMFAEYFLLKSVYNRTPALAVKDEITEKNNHKKEKPVKKKKSVFQKMFGFILVIKDGWKLYMDQVIALAGLGMAFLYLTVLGFGYVTTSYAYNQCFSEFLVGITLASAGFTGIVGTFIFPILSSRFGLVKAGLYSGIFQVLTLIPCIASVFVSGILEFPPPESFLSMWLLVGGLVAARAGLWSFDLTITQLYQENVVESERGIVNGVQTSLNMLMDLLMYIAVLFLSKPDEFGILVLASSAAVTTGYIFYGVFTFRVGKRFDKPKTPKAENVKPV